MSLPLELIKSAEDDGFMNMMKQELYQRLTEPSNPGDLVEVLASKVGRNPEIAGAMTGLLGGGGVGAGLGALFGGKGKRLRGALIGGGIGGGLGAAAGAGGGNLLLRTPLKGQVEQRLRNAPASYIQELRQLYETNPALLQDIIRLVPR